MPRSESAPLLALRADFPPEQRARFHDAVEQCQLAALSLPTVGRSAVTDVLRSLLSRVPSDESPVGPALRALQAAVVARALVLPGFTVPHFYACSTLFRALMQDVECVGPSSHQTPAQETATAAAPPGPVDDRVLRAVAFISEGHAKGTFSEAWVAKRVELSPTRLSRLFRTHMGMYFHEYVKAYRIYRALTPLFESRVTIREIAEKVGYSHVSTFDRHFAQLLGCRPRDFRACAWHTPGQWVALSTSKHE